MIYLEPLTNEEMLILVEKLRDIHAMLYDYPVRLQQQDLIYFIQIEYSRIGAQTNITPREVIRDFIELLNLLLQDSNITIEMILRSTDFSFAKPALQEDSDGSPFAEFEV